MLVCSMKKKTIIGFRNIIGWLKREDYSVHFKKIIRDYSGPEKILIEWKINVCIPEGIITFF